MKKRLLSLLCVLALCLGLLPGTAWAAEEWTFFEEYGYTCIQSADGAIKLEISKDDTAKTISITDRYGDLPSECELVLPESVTINGEAYTVTSIGKSAFARQSDFFSLTLPSTITSIGYQAFISCTSLASVDFSACTSLTSIGEDAFSYTALTSVTLPASLTSIGKSAFNQCSQLSAADLSACVNLTSIGEMAFYQCDQLSAADLSACTSLTSIGANAFSYTALTSVTLPASLTSIGGTAFGNCALTVVTFLAPTPPTLDGSVSTVFPNCSSLTAVYVPADSLAAYTRAWGTTIVIGGGIVVKIQAIVEESMTLTPESAEWSGEYGTDFGSKTFTIANVGDDTLTISSVELGGTNADDFTLNTASMANSLSANADTTFTVTPNSGLAVGEYTATVTVTATVNGETETKEATLTCTVSAKSLTGAQVQVASDDYTYTGEEIKPGVTVTLEGETLAEGTDYTLSYTNNTDAGEATVTAAGKGNYSGTATGSFTINKATPTVTGVAVSDSIGTIYDTTDISTITLTYTDSDTPGTVTLTAGQTLHAGSGTYNWTFTPTDTANYNTATGEITLTVEADTLEKIEVTTVPSKIEYTYGENFDKTGMVVTATYLSGTTEDVTEEVAITPETLTAGVTELTISYGGKETTLEITVNPKEISIESATVADKTYNGDTDATVESVTFSDDVQLTADDYTATATFTDASANDNQSATVKVTLTNRNYTFVDGKTEATFNTNAKISPLKVALEWNYQAPFTYDGNEKSVSATVTNRVGEDEITLTYENNAKTAVGEYTAKVTGLGNDNYTLTGASGTEQAWSITKANPDVNVPTGLTATYGNTLNDVTLTSGWTWDDAVTTSVGNVGDNTFSATFTPSDTDNYNTVTKNLTVAVSAKDITNAVITLGDALTYTGQQQTQQIASVTVDGLTVTYTVTGNTGTDADTYTLTISGTGNFTGEATQEWSIAKATYTGTTGVLGTVLANWPDEVTLPDIPDGASYGAASTTDDLTGLSIEGSVLSYTGGSGITEGQAYKITVPVNGGNNYENYDITVTLTGTDKQVLDITGVTAQGGTYNGQPYQGYTGTPSAEGYDGGFTVTYSTTDGKAPTDAGTYTATIAIPEDNAQYVGSMDLQFTIAPKALTVSAPSLSIRVGDSAPELALTYTGLVAGESVTPSEDPVFTITKADGTVIALEDAVKTAGTYTITWSNADQGFTGDENYDIQTETAGTLTVSTRSSGGGGSSNITTETTKNPDGSTTITVTNKVTGTVTETTTWPDGSKEVIETKKDGTVTTTTTDTAGNQTAVVEKPDGSSQTTVNNKDGSGSVTLVDADGNIISQTTLSEAAIAAAQAAGEAVALPMPAVPVTTDQENAPTVTVDLPVGGSVKVEIPVEDVTPGTVAVLVKSNGDEEIIKTSVTTGSGVAVTLNDGDTVKIVDNSKTFDDVADNYWGAEAVAFASSRELFAGTSATTFAPDTAMTRAMIVTVLARFEGVDTTTGDTWYEAGQQWAMQNGISDGSNMEQDLTREQLATMLYRYAQSKGYDTTQGGMAIREYADFEQISGYAVEAMTWAVNTGIIKGTSSTTISPQSPGTRAQMATILMRFIEMI